jgi:hypothetical protein
MIVAAHQPSFLPGLAYLDKMAKADLFVVMDDLAFEPNRFLNRQRIKVSDGDGWLTVPVVPQPDGRICAARSDTTGSWRRRTWMAIETAYGSAPYFDVYADELREVFSQRWDRLLDLDLQLLELARGALRIHVPIMRASSLGLSGSNTARIIELCKRVGAHGYLSGTGASGSLDVEQLGRAGITMIWQHFEHPTYAQRFPELGFLPHLGFVDLLLNCGPDGRDVVFDSSHPLRAHSIA